MSENTNESRLRKCAGCGRMTRPRNTPAPPGIETICRISADRCYPCYNRDNPNMAIKRARDAEAREAEKKAKVESAQKAYAAFLATRQRRLGDLPRRSRVLVTR